MIDPLPTRHVELERVLDRSKDLGFLGPGAVTDHIDHAAGFLELLDGRTAIVDLGSGGGVPGLVLAVALEPTRWTLVDGMAKRCRFLEWAVDELDVADRVAVRCGRAEDLAREVDLRGHADAVVARSFGPPAVTAECAVGFLRAGGRLIVSEPPDATASEERWPAAGVAQLGLRLGARHEHAVGAVQVLELEGECDERFPRRVGVPAKRPLF